MGSRPSAVSGLRMNPTLVFSLTLLMLACKTAPLRLQQPMVRTFAQMPVYQTYPYGFGSHAVRFYGKRMAEDTMTAKELMDARHLTKRSPQDPPPAEGDEAAKPPVWCSFSLPWRGVSGLVDKRCQEIAGVGATK